MTVDHLLMTGSVDRNIRVTFVYDFHGENEPYQTIHEGQRISIRPSYGIRLSKSFDDKIYISGSRYFQFVSLLNQTVRLISDHLYELFPNVNRTEFEIDNMTLQRFQTERALSSGGIVMVPCVWVNPTSECFPAVRISNINSEFVLPLDDAIAINQMFSTFDPLTFGLMLLRILGKIE